VGTETFRYRDLHLTL